MKTATTVCGRCGANVVGDATREVCPACLLETGLGLLDEESVAGVVDPDRQPSMTHGTFVLRDRDQLYTRINNRVEAMFENGVIEEVRAAGAISSTASKMIGLHEIRELLDGKISILQCVAAIQQATRRYAKRQLTWFRGQTSFQPLNLSLLSHSEAVKWILLRKHSEPRIASGVRPQG